VFLHGIGATIRVWSRLVTFLPKSLDVYLIDLLGHGKSDAPKIDYTADVQAQTVKEFVALIDGDCYLFGHSYGGWIAAHYASQQFACKGMILEDPSGLKRSFERMPKDELKNFRESMVKSEMRENDNREYVMRSIMYSDADLIDDRVLAKINIPTMVVWGSEDKMINIKFADDFAKGIKNSRLEIIAGAGHNPHYTNPKQVSEIIMKFVTR
jgi:pimeloyl-ACP methyl ester carboxylesterase